MTTVSNQLTDGQAENVRSSQLKQWILGLVKVVISFGILGYLFSQALQDQSFDVLVSQDKNWGLLLASYLVALAAVAITFVRWFLLVRALDLDFTLASAFRIGFIGHLFNFLSVGIVGGDLLRSYYIAKDQPGRRAMAVATVVVDRIIGLFALVVLAAVALMFFSVDPTQVRDQENLKTLETIKYVAIFLSFAGLAGFSLLAVPAVYQGNWLAKIPKVGHIAQRLLQSMALFQQRKRIILLAFLMSVVTHTMFATSVYLIASALPVAHPTLATHLMIVPIANACGALPLPGGLGAMEAALDFLYRIVTSAEVPARYGFVIAIGYRIVTLLIAAVGVVYYLAFRKEMKSLVEKVKVEDG